MNIYIRNREEDYLPVSKEDIEKYISNHRKKTFSSLTISAFLSAVSLIAAGAFWDGGKDKQAYENAVGTCEQAYSTNFCEVQPNIKGLKDEAEKAENGVGYAMWVFLLGQPFLWYGFVKSNDDLSPGAVELELRPRRNFNVGSKRNV